MGFLRDSLVIGEHGIATGEDAAKVSQSGEARQDDRENDGQEDKGHGGGIFFDEIGFGEIAPVSLHLDTILHRGKAGYTV